MRNRTLLAAVLAVLGLGVGAVAVYASIPDSSGVIHGCYARSGALRVIDSATASCTNKETALNWNQSGPPGPAGPAGPQGAPGPAGPQGAPGTSGWEMVTASGGPAAGASATAICPAGKTVLGGGAEASQPNPVDALAISRPLQANGGGGAVQGQNAWYGRLSGTVVTGNDTINVFAICALVQP